MSEDERADSRESESTPAAEPSPDDRSTDPEPDSTTPDADDSDAEGPTDDATHRDGDRPSGETDGRRETDDPDGPGRDRDDGRTRDDDRTDRRRERGGDPGRDDRPRDGRRDDGPRDRGRDDRSRDRGRDDRRRDRPPADRGARSEGRGGPGVVDLLKRPATVDQLKYVIGLYALVGVGTGLLGFVVGETVGGGGAALLGALVGLLAVLVLFAVGPFMATVFSIRIADRMSDPEDGRMVYLATGVGNGVGFVVMLLLGSLISLVVGGGGGGGGGGAPGGGGGGGASLGDLLLPILAAGVVVGLIGAGTVYFLGRVDAPGRASPARGDPAGRSDRAGRSRGSDDRREEAASGRRR